MTNTIIESAIKTINSILGIKELPNFGTIPQPLVALSSARAGMSAIRATEKVLAMKKQFNIPTGNLLDGSANHDDILWYTAIQAIMDEITNEARITAVSIPGTQVVASGGNAGGPIVVYGSTITFSNGGAIIE